MAGVVRVLIVDDQAPFRRAASTMLAQVDGFEVVGEAASGEEGVSLAATSRAELVLMDVRLPGINGAEATRQILHARPDTVVVLVSTYRAADLPGEIATCGAAGFLRKEDVVPDVLAELCRRG